MTNRGGRSKAHCLKGKNYPTAKMWKQENKEKARQRNNKKMKAFQELTKGC